MMDGNLAMVFLRLFVDAYMVMPKSEALFEDRMAELEATTLRSPAASGVVTSPFHARRPPDRLHQGVDIPCAIGEPIRAAAPGLLIAKGWADRERTGIMVQLRHAREGKARIVQTNYYHLGSVFKKGKARWVAAGEKIGTCGRTAVKTAPTHLHFEVLVLTKKGIRPIDPCKVIDLECPHKRRRK